MRALLVLLFLFGCGGSDEPEQDDRQARVRG